MLYKLLLLGGVLYFTIISTIFSFNSPSIKNTLHNYVQFLSSPALQGRMTGSFGEKIATQYVATQFQQFGLEPAGDHDTFFQEFKVSSTFTPGKKIHSGRNVLAKLIIDPHNTQFIVVGAHIDHLGQTKNNIYPGADDNASGVACILESAAQLKILQRQGKLHGNKNILFAAWSGEEIGILGSSHFVKQYIITHQSLRPTIDVALNLDMVGHLQKSLILQGVGSSTDWPQLIKHLQANDATITPQEDPYLPTDSTAFYLQGVPVLNFFTGAHINYHSMNDTADTLNYVGLKTISELLVNTILTLEQHASLLHFQNSTHQHTKMGRDFKIYLGTIPDYARSEVSGVALSGVTKNSPAELAGLQQNDIIIALADKKIHDIYDYSFVLNQLAVGKPVKMIVWREKTKMTLTVIPSYR